MKNFVIFILVNVPLSLQAQITAYIDIPSTDTLVEARLLDYQYFEDNAALYNEITDEDLLTTISLGRMKNYWLDTVVYEYLKDYCTSHTALNGNFISQTEFNDLLWEDAEDAFVDLKDTLSDRAVFLQEWYSSSLTPEAYYSSNSEAQAEFSTQEEFVTFINYYQTPSNLNLVINTTPTTLSEAYNSDLRDQFELEQYQYIFVDEELTNLGHSSVINDLTSPSINFGGYNYALKKIMLSEHSGDVTFSSNDAATTWTIFVNEFQQAPAPPPLDTVWP